MVNLLNEQKKHLDMELQCKTVKIMKNSMYIPNIITKFKDNIMIRPLKIKNF